MSGRVEDSMGGFDNNIITTDAKPRKRKISRMWIIRELCKKHYKAVRPTAKQINNVIHMYKLNRYSVDGKKRSKEVVKEYIKKAYAKLN